MVISDDFRYCNTKCIVAKVVVVIKTGNKNLHDIFESFYKLLGKENNSTNFVYF